MTPGSVAKDRPWVMRTYSGHSTARASNELYRTNLAKGQTGLSIAFDLPTQTGYDPDAPRGGRRGGQGRRARRPPRATWGSCSTASRSAEMNTSMTINATAAWLLGLYIANAEDQGVDPAVLPGTTQNDIVKEYLSPGHLHLPARAEPAADRRHDRLHRAPRPEVEPDQRVQLPPAGGGGHARCRSWPTRWPRPSACSTPCATRARSPPTTSRRWSGASRSSSTPASASSRRRARCGPSPACGTGSASSATASRTPSCAGSATACRSTRSASPRSSPRTTCSASCSRCSASPCRSDARARSIQLPAWNEALGLPRPWDQQWSLRIQQVLAFETDLLEYDDIFEGSHGHRGQDGRAGRGRPGRARRRPGPRAGPSRPSTS